MIFCFAKVLLKIVIYNHDTTHVFLLSICTFYWSMVYLNCLRWPENLAANLLAKWALCMALLDDSVIFSVPFDLLDCITDLVSFGI